MWPWPAWWLVSLADLLWGLRVLASLSAGLLCSCTNGTPVGVGRSNLNSQSAVSVVYSAGLHLVKAGCSARSCFSLRPELRAQLSFTPRCTRALNDSFSPMWGRHHFLQIYLVTASVHAPQPGLSFIYYVICGKHALSWATDCVSLQCCTERKKEETYVSLYKWLIHLLNE